MYETIRVQIDAAREVVWAALYGDLAASGPHVEVLQADEPASLRLRLRTAPGERQELSYTLEADDEGTIVSAFMAVEGPLYAFKRIFSLGMVDRGYLRQLAVGLDNLRGHFTPRDRAPEADEG